MRSLKFYFLMIWLIAWSAPTYAGQYNVGMFWTVADKQDPTCTISTAISGWQTANSQTINFVCTDNTGLKSVECRINGGAWVACNSWSQHTITGITSGSSTTFEVRANDVYSRVSVVGAGQTRSWSTDFTVPTVSLGTISGTNSGSPSIAFSGSDAHSGLASFQCSYDTGTAAWVTCTSPRAGSSPTAGQTYYFRVRALDVAGNTGSIAQTSWTNGNWGGFGGCSASCGGGNQTRFCNNPAPSVSPAGAGCAGSATQSCNTQACCVNASLTTNMCPGYVYYAASQTSCLGCPGSVTASADIAICVDATCTAQAAATTVSCANGSATVTSDGGCPSKGAMGIYSCTCN